MKRFLYSLLTGLLLVVPAALLRADGGFVPPSPAEVFVSSLSLHGVFTAQSPCTGWSVTMTNLDTGASSTQTFPPGNGTLGPSLINSATFVMIVPNAHMEVTESCQNGLNLASFDFFMQPVPPANPILPLNVGNGSVSVQFQNSDPSLGLFNTPGTVYQMTVTGPGGPFTGVADTTRLNAVQDMGIIVTGLQPSASYTATLKALSRDETDGWMDSPSLALGTFSTPASNPSAVEITSINPSFYQIVGFGFPSFQITGQNFQSGASVNFYLNGSTNTVTASAVGPNSLTVTLNYVWFQVGVAYMQVINPDNSQSNSFAFPLLPSTEVSPFPQPNYLVPTSKVQNTGSFTLEVFGVDFLANSIIQWNGVNRTNNTTFVSSTELTTLINNSEIQTVGIIPVRVYTPVGTAGGGGLSGALPFAVTPAGSNPAPVAARIVVTPTPVQLSLGQTQLFTAQAYDVNSNPITVSSFTWTRGNSANGLDQTGLFTAGTVGPDFVQAAAGGVSGTAIVNVVNSNGCGGTPLITITPYNPSVPAGTTQNFQATYVNPCNQTIPNTLFFWSVQNSGSVITSTGSYTSAPCAGTDTVYAASGNTKGNTPVTITGNAFCAPVSVSMNPTSASLTAGQTQAFTATVANASNTSVVWSITPNVGSLLNETGTAVTYDAPATILTAQTVTLTATSNADATKSASAVITLNPATSSTGPGSCATQGFVGGSASPTIVTPGGAYAISCDYGVANSNEIQVNAGSGNCTFKSFNGTAAQFTCTAGSLSDTFANSCKLNDISPDNLCARTDSINSVTVSNGTPAPTCAPQSFVGGTVSPESVAPLGAYTMTCDYGVANINDLRVNPGSGSCAFTGFIGTTAQFACTAGIQSNATFADSCQINEINPDKLCARTDSLDPLTVVGNGNPLPPSQTPVLTTLQVLPPAATVKPGATIPFQYEGFDQYGNPISAGNVTWSVYSPNNSTINLTSGLYTAGPQTGVQSDTVIAQSGAIKGTATVYIQNPGGFEINNITAVPNPVYGSSTTLTVMAVDLNGGTLTYSWNWAGPAGVGIVHPNQAQSAAVFSAPGTYTLTATVYSSTFPNFPLTASIAVNVIQTISKVVVTPPFQEIYSNQQASFQAQVLDQFNAVMANQPVNWSVPASAGAISQSGSYSPSSGVVNQQVTVTAISQNNPAAQPGTAVVQIITVGSGGGSFDISAAHAYPVPWKSTDGVPYVTFTGLAAGTQIRIFTTHGREVNNLTSMNGEDVHWFTDNNAQERMASGVYLYLINNSTSGQKIKGKVVVIQ